MSRRATSRLAWSSWALTLALFGLGFLFANMNESTGLWTSAPFLLPLLAFPTVGAVVASRRPANPIGWIFCAVGVLTGFWFVGGQYAVYSLVTAPGSLPGGVWVAWLAVWAGEPGWGLISTFLPLLFPTGRLVSKRWRTVAWLAGITIAIQVATDLITPGRFSLHSMGAHIPPVNNPTGIQALTDLMEPLSNAVQLLFFAVALLCFASVVLRFRRAVGQERQQMKWFVYAVVIVILLVSTDSFIQASPFGSAYQASTDPLHQARDAVLTSLAIIAFPVAVGLAIVRHRLYDIDIIINRTLVYGTLTATLLLVYFGSVVLLEQVVRSFTGQEHSDLVIVVSTLAIAALFNPLRKRIQAFIDRRFYRRKYDASKTLSAFSATVRDEVDLNKLTARLVEVVEETLQPERVSLWLLRPEKGA